MIGAGALEAADVARPFHVTVRQELVRAGGVPLLVELLEQQAVLLQGEENGLRNLEMIFGMRGCEQVVGDAVAFEDFQEGLVIFLVDFLDRYPFLVRGNHDGRPVRVRAADHQDVIPFQAVVARNDVTGQMGTRDISNVDFRVGVRPGDCD